MDFPQAGSLKIWDSRHGLWQHHLKFDQVVTYIRNLNVKMQVVKEGCKSNEVGFLRDGLPNGWITENVEFQRD